MSSKPIKVAIVGGGCAGIAAAFELDRPGLAGKYEVPFTNWDGGRRQRCLGPRPGRCVEEHGLHLWMGFYENAFQLMRECYAELGRDRWKCSIADWTDAFFADSFCGVIDRIAERALVALDGEFPRHAGPAWRSRRGSPVDGRRLSAAVGDLVRTLLETHTNGGARSSSRRTEPPQGPWALSPGELTRLMKQIVSYGHSRPA